MPPKKLPLAVASLAVALLVLLTTARGVLAQESEVDIYTLPGERVFPEGVAYQEETGHFYVGSTTDGTIYRGNVENDRLEVFLPGGQDGRTTAVGLKASEGALVVAGGTTGKVFIYDTTTKVLVASPGNGEQQTFLNDIALTQTGIYVTDSLNPVLYEIVQVLDDEAFEFIYELREFLSLENTAIEYQEGFNLNGIAATEDGRYLIVVQSNTGKLFRIARDTKEVIEIDTGGASFTNGDGLVLDGQVLYVVRNQQELIVPVLMSDDFGSGVAGEPFTDPSLMFPTTIAKYDNRLLVVNSQFDAREGGRSPELPFTVSGIPIPGDIPTGPGDTGGGGLAARFPLTPFAALGVLTCSLVATLRARRTRHR